METFTSLQPADQALLLTAVDELREREVLSQLSRMAPFDHSCSAHHTSSSGRPAHLPTRSCMQGVESKAAKATLLSFGRSHSQVSNQLPANSPDTSLAARASTPEAAEPATPSTPTPATPSAGSGQGEEGPATQRTHSSSTADASLDGLLQQAPSPPRPDSPVSGSGHACIPAS